MVICYNSFKLKTLFPQEIIYSIWKTTLTEEIEYIQFLKRSTLRIPVSRILWWCKGEMFFFGLNFCLLLTIHFIWPGQLNNSPLSSFLIFSNFQCQAVPPCRAVMLGTGESLFVLLNYQQHLWQSIGLCQLLLSHTMLWHSLSIIKSQGSFTANSLVGAT